MSSQTFPTHEDRYHALLPVRFVDFTLLSVTYACMVCMNFAVIGFWVQVSLKFAAAAKASRRTLLWGCFTRGIQVLAWCTFLGFALVLVWSEDTAIVFVYNMQAMFYGVSMWIGMAVAYRTVYRHSMSNLTTWLVAKKSKAARRKHARQKKNLMQVTRLAFGSIGLLTAALLSLLAATAFDWTSHPLPYLVVVGVLYLSLIHI